MTRKLAGLACLALGVALWLARPESRAGREEGASETIAERAEANGSPLVSAPARAALAGERERPPAAEPAKQAAIPDAPASPSGGVEEGTTLFFGRAVDGRSGSALAQAHAEVRNGALVFDGGELPPTVLVSAESSSGADGILALEYVDAGVPTFLLLTCAGYGPRRFLLESGHATRAEAQVLELQPCASLEVRVRDGEGAPLEGRTVELAEPATLVPARDRVSSRKGSVWRATTDEGGRAFLPCLPAGVLFQLGFPTERSTRMRLALEPGERREVELIAGFAELRGLVLDDAGSPLAHYCVELTRPHPDAHVSGSFTDSSFTDAFGRFEFSAISFGEWQLGAGYGPWSRILIDRPVVEVVHRGERGKMMAGRVVLEDSDEREGITVFARSRSSPRMVLSAWSGWSKESFFFGFYDVPPGDYDLFAWEEGGGSEVVRAVAGDEEIELSLPAKVALTVLTPGFSGEGELCVLDRARGGAVSRSIGGGSAELRLGPGEYALRFTTPDGRIGFEPAVVVARAAAPPVVQLDVQPGAVLVLALASGSGECTLRLRAGGGLFEERTLVPGENVISAVPAGAIVVELVDGEGVSASQRIELAPLERRWLALD